MDGLIDEETLQDVYAWIDKIPLSKPKRNIARDFSDGGNVTLLTVAVFINKTKGLANFSCYFI